MFSLYNEIQEQNYKPKIIYTNTIYFSLSKISENIIKFNKFTRHLIMFLYPIKLLLHNPYNKKVSTDMCLRCKQNLLFIFCIIIDF